MITFNHVVSGAGGGGGGGSGGEVSVGGGRGVTKKKITTRGSWVDVRKTAAGWMGAATFFAKESDKQPQLLVGERDRSRTTLPPSEEEDKKKRVKKKKKID